jgi:uncharacterized protein (TIGR03000 family)
MTVPEDARVFVDDYATTSTGGQRRFVARGIQRGETYVYRVRVEFNSGGETVVRNKLASIRAGDVLQLDFTDTERMADQRKTTTSLTLHVPKSAKVTLAGAPTNQKGERRTFASSALTAGEKWDDYLVRVEVEQDGETLVEEKALTLVGGEKYELTFDFADESPRLAALD